MRSLSLRWRIIIALIALALGTTLALSLLARYFLDKSLRIGVNPEIEQVLDNALVLAKESYDRRKTILTGIGDQLADSPHLADAYRGDNAAGLEGVCHDAGLENLSYRFVSVERGGTGTMGLKKADGPRVLRDPERGDLLQLVVPVREGGRQVAALLVTEPLDELLSVEQAVQTYKHFRMMIEADLRREFVLGSFAVAAAVVLVASLIGIRIGFEITGPLYSLVKGTRELARDNLDYQIPPGRNDEIGLVIRSFNRMVEDLKENRRQRLEAEKIAAWQEIARRLAHEIKNPLTPIQLTVQQLRDKYSGNDPAYKKLVEDCTEIVTEEVETLRSLVQEFADFARMPSLSLSRHSLDAVVEDVVRLYPEARIQLDLAPAMSDVDLDVEQMRRVLINLIENGIEAAGRNGTLTIRTQQTESEAKMLVIDSGPGVSEGDRERVFQPHFTTKEDGMGLGLTVVRSIVENHGGRVSVAHAPEGGAQFEVILPLPDRSSRKPEVDP